MLMMLLPVSVSAQTTAYVSTYAELSAAISNASVTNIVVTANIDVPCETSKSNGDGVDYTGASTAQLVINRSLTLQSQAGSKYIIKRVVASGATYNALKSLIAIHGNGNRTSGTANLTENTVEVTFTNIIIDGGAEWGNSTVSERRSAANTSYSCSGRSIIDVYLGGMLNLEDGVEIRNGFTTKSDNSLLDDTGTSQCFGGGVRVDYHNQTGGGTVNIKAGAVIHDCSTKGGYGGALGAYNNARLNLYGGTIYNCSANNGGAIACTYRAASGYDGTTAGTIRMYGGTISDCYAESGGAFLMHGANDVDDYILGGTITSCSATSGGAMYVGGSASGNAPTVHMVAHSSGWLTFSNCTNTNATATSSTGGYSYVYKYAGTISETPVYQVTFRNNNTDFAVLHVLQGDSLSEAFPAAPAKAGIRFLGWYNGNTQVTSSTVINGNITVTAQWEFYGNGTEAVPYQIPSTDAWDFLAYNVNNGDTYSGKYFQQTANISITTMVGIDTGDGSYKPFCGTYDGNGKTLNVSMTSEKFACTAPFTCISGATIKNMHVTGSISTTGMRPAGIAGFVSENSTITNCWSAVAISSSRGSDIDAGGFVARVNNGKSLTLNGCLFTGSITYSNGSGYEGGGMVGWTQDNATATLNNCVFAPSALSIINYTDHYIYVGGNVRGIINNCYYNDLANSSSLIKEGKHWYTITAGTNVTISGLGEATGTYNVSGITAYTHGIKYNETYYAGNGDVVSLNLSGSNTGKYAAFSGTLTGNSNPYTLTMAAANSVISEAVASVTTSANVTTNYNNFSDAVSAWVNNSTLTLLADATLSSRIEINNTRTIDLNGYGIRMTGSDCFFRVLDGGSLTMIDNSPTRSTHTFNISDHMAIFADGGSYSFQGGYLTGAPGYYSEGNYRRGGAVHIEDNGLFTMRGGTIIGNHACFGGGVAAHSGTFVMEGGAIIYNKATDCSYHGGGGIWVEGGPGGKFTLGGTALVEQNYTNGYNGSQVFVEGGNNAIDAMTITGGSPRVINSASSSNLRPSNRIVITGELTTEANLSLLLDQGVFTTGYSSHNSTTHPNTYFHSENAGYVVGRNTSGEAYLHTPYTVTYDGNGNDGGAVPTDNATYAGGVAVTIPSAVLTKTGYTFTGWLNSVDGQTYAAGDNFTITANTTLTAQWTINKYTITANAVPSAGGDVEGVGNYNYGTEITLTATPAVDYHFVQWQDGNSNNPRTVIVTGDATYTASFALDEYRIDSIPLTWQVKIGDGNPFFPTPYTENPTAADTMGYVMIPVNSEFFIIPSNNQKPLISKLELIDKQPLTFEAMTTGTIKVNDPQIGMQYKLNNGAKITMTETTTINVAVGDKVRFYGNGTSITSYYGTTIAGGTAQVKAYGNIMSLVDEMGYASTTTSLHFGAFRDLFSDNTTLTDASGLQLPATTLTNSCYSQMFQRCTNLTMAPELPATTLADECYKQMFQGCTSLTMAPELPATTLADECYYQMFYGCSNINSVTCLATDISATNCTTGWLDGVATEGTFYKPMSMNGWTIDSPNGIPVGWTTIHVASFTNPHAIIKFMLKNNANNATINATSLAFTDGTNTYTIKPASGTSVLYVAIPGFSSQDIRLIATVGSTIYHYEEDNVTFDNGSNYEIEVKMTDFNAEATTNPTLNLFSDIDVENFIFTITRADGVVDFNGHEMTTRVFIQNNTSGKTVTLQNGFISSPSDGIDGKNGWENFYYGTVRLINMTVPGNIFTDGHAYIIDGGTYANVENVTYLYSTSYPASVTINGGYYDDLNHLDSDSWGWNYVKKGSYTLYGGYYKFNPSERSSYIHIASGYHVETVSGEYGWRVVPD